MKYSDAQLAFAGLTLIFLIIVFIFSLICYFFRAIGLSRIAKNNGREDKAFMAWIPFANNYLLGEMTGEVSFGDSFKIQSNIVPIVAIFSSLFFCIPYAGYIIAMVWNAVFYNTFFKRYYPEKATKYTVLSVLLGWFSFIVFGIRYKAVDRLGGMNAGYNTYNTSDPYNNNFPS